MKIQPEDSFSNLKQQNRYTKKKTPIENHSETKSMLIDDVLTTWNTEGEPEDKSTRRALELSRKGIFACPKFTRFFNDDEDDLRIC
jgi:hypothetical protein